MGFTKATGDYIDQSTLTEVGGGGAAGGKGTQNGFYATANTRGGSGGGGQDGTSGNGGSGVVILRYPSSYTISETTSPTVLTFNTYTEGSDKVTVFTSGTNGTIQFT